MTDILYNLVADPDSYWIAYDLYLENSWANIDLLTTLPWWQTGLYRQTQGRYNHFFSSSNGKVATMAPDILERSFCGKMAVSRCHHTR
jgi:hypothetical protein